MIKQYFYLTILFFFCGVFLVLQQAFGLLPLENWEFAALFLVVLTAAFFYPKKLFWFFIFLLPFENLIVSPEIVPISMRPYQVVGFALIVVTIIKELSNNCHSRGGGNLLVHCVFLNKWISAFAEMTKAGSSKIFIGIGKKSIFLLPLFAFLAIVNAPDQLLSAKQVLVLTSFVALFWMAGNYLKTNKQKFEALWFFLVSSKIVIIFGIYQAIAYKLGWPHFEVMPGRINSTFTEPDWLGMYLVFVLALVLWAKFAVKNGWKENVMLGKFKMANLLALLLDIYLILIFTGLILTVARSAWLAAVALLGVYFIFGLIYYARVFLNKTQNSKRKTQNHNSKVKTFIAELFIVVLMGIFSLVIVFIFNLTSFHFFNRAASSVSGLQKITVSCLPDGMELPEKVQITDELSQYGCRHINLEEIPLEMEKGMVVGQIYRPDPNVEIRKDIYRTAWSEISKHPFLGQGLGSSSIILGTDELGHGLNSSNIFLESWLSMGIGGLLILLFIFFYPLYKAFFILDFCQKTSYNYILFLVITMTALIVPNLFNSGLFLGYFWVWLSSIQKK